MTEQLGVHKDIILEASIGADGIIYITVGGDVMNEYLIAFVAWAKRSKNLSMKCRKENRDIFLY